MSRASRQVATSIRRPPKAAPLAILPLAGIVLTKLVLHLVTSGQYGYSRDELYYLACAEHLSAGYVDHPPLVPLVAGLVRATIGDSLLAIRLLPALAGAGTVFLAGVITSQLGGRRFAQVLAALAVVAAPAYLGMNAIFTTNAFDQLLWALALYLVLRILRAETLRLWLLLGLVLGMGLLTKHTMAFLMAGLAVGLALSPERRLLTTRGALTAAAMAGALFLPNLIWQWAHDWPTLEFLARAQINRMPEVNPLIFLWRFAVALQPVTLPIWVLGIAFLLVHKQGRPWRSLGWMFVVLLVIDVIGRAKEYYLVPIAALLFPAGAVVIESWLERRRWEWARPVMIATVLLAGAASAPFYVPILPLEQVVRYKEAWDRALHARGAADAEAIPLGFAEMLGWEEMVATVAEVYHRLPAEERARCAVSGNNYGQAAAIDFFGTKYGLPKSISTHNSYWTWGTHGYSGDPMITIGVRREALAPAYTSVELGAVVQHDHVIWYETNQPVYLWRGIKAPLATLWPQMKLIY